MTATEEAMTGVTPANNMFLATSDEEPEINSINFRQSLRFFQEQLIINGNNFPKPSVTRLSNNEVNNKYGFRFIKPQNTEDNGTAVKTNEIYNDDIQSFSSCRIPIPTVDTILESVRVLRAIQKSQEERGSAWSLDVTSKGDTDTDNRLSNALLQLEKAAQKGLSCEEPLLMQDNANDQGSENEQQYNTLLTNRGNCENDKVEVNHFKTNVVTTLLPNETCPFWPSNIIVKQIDIFNTHTVNNESTINIESSYANEIAAEKTDNNYSSAKSINTIMSPQRNGLDHSDGCEKLEKQFEQNSNQSDTDDSRLNDSNEILSLNQASDFSILNGSNSLDNEKPTDYAQKESLPTFSISNDVSFKSDINDTDFMDITSSENLINSKKNLSSDAEQFLDDDLEIDPASYEQTFVQIQNHETVLYENVLLDNFHTKEGNFTKAESIDCDSGIGTQRSISSASPTHQPNLQKDSWSDSCSSQYVSAECSPCHSLNSVFHSSHGFNTSIPTSTKECAENEYATITSDNQWDGNSLQQSSDTPEDIPKYKDTTLPTTTSSCRNDTELEMENLSKWETENLFESSITSSSYNEWEGDALQQISDTSEDIPKYEDTMLSTPSSNDTELEMKNVSKLETKHLFESNITSSSDETVPDNNDSENLPLRALDRQDSYCSYASVDFVPSSPTSTTHQQNTLEYDTRPYKSDIDQESTDKCSAENITNGDTKYDEKKCNNAEYTEPQNKNGAETNDTDDAEIRTIKKFTTSSWNLLSIMESLYRIQEDPPYKALQEMNDEFEREVFILSQGAFTEYSDGIYTLSFDNSYLYITQESQILLSFPVNYATVFNTKENVLKLDSRLGRCLYFKCDSENHLMQLREEIELQCLKHWQTECLKLVHYPLKYHQNVIIIDLGSCSTRAGILMDQPTLPRIFFPSVCATDKLTGNCIYGMEALQPEVRQNSNLSFPVRPSIKIIKHTLDIDLLGGLFTKIFQDLNVDPTQYTVQLCLPRSLSINAQSALVKLLLEDLNVAAVSLTNQAILTLYAHDVSSAVVVDIGDRMDILPVVDGFIVENGVTRLPYGGQRLIHHMKHALAEKHLSLSNDIDSFIVQYITENVSYVAEDYESEIHKASQNPEIVKKTVSLQPFTCDGNIVQHITLDDARFTIPEGLFNPELWGLDSPGIHHLVQRAIAATGVDVRKQMTENIYVSGGVTLLPGFVERLCKEITKLNKTKAIPKVYASNYRYHCTYIGACKFARMDVFPQVCVTSKEYNKNGLSSLKKFLLCF